MDLIWYLNHNMCVSSAARYITTEDDIISDDLVRVSETRLTFDYDLTAISPLVLYIEDKKVLRHQGNVERLQIISITNIGTRVGQCT